MALQNLVYRPGDSEDHGKGLAADFIVGNNTVRNQVTLMLLLT